MGTFYTDEQIQEAIAALEAHTPGIFERMKKSASITNPFDDEQETELSATSRASRQPVGVPCFHCPPAIFAAAITAWVRLSTPSFCRIAETCALMVASETPSS